MARYMDHEMNQCDSSEEVARTLEGTTSVLNWLQEETTALEETLLKVKKRLDPFLTTGDQGYDVPMGASVQSDDVSPLNQELRVLVDRLRNARDMLSNIERRVDL